MLDWLTNMTPQQQQLLNFGLQTMAASRSPDPNSKNAGWALSQGMKGLTLEQQRQFANQREEQDKAMRQQYYEMMAKYLREKEEEKLRPKGLPPKNPLSSTIDRLPGNEMFNTPFWDMM